MRSFYPVLFLTLLLACVTVDMTYAQCAMCKAVAESGGNNALYEGLNAGIIYLMATPYLVLGFLAVLFYGKSFRKWLGERIG